MDALEAIRRRRSVRNFTGEAIPRTDLEAIVDAGRLAASGRNQQPCDFVVVTGRETLGRLAVVQWMEKAGAIIAVVVDPATRYWIEDGSAAIENLLLASTALGYGSCWVGGEAAPREEEFKAFLGVPQEKRLMALIPIGVPVEWPTKEKRSLDEVLHWERY
jgi:nitroreductase